MQLVVARLIAYAARLAFFGRLRPRDADAEGCLLASTRVFPASRPGALPVRLTELIEVARPASNSIDL
jgi:hypothetical protein